MLDPASIVVAVFIGLIWILNRPPEFLTNPSSLITNADKVEPFVGAGPSWHLASTAPANTNPRFSTSLDNKMPNLKQDIKSAMTNLQDFALRPDYDKSCNFNMFYHDYTTA